MTPVMQNYCSLAFGTLVRAAVARTLVKGSELAVSLNLPERGELTREVLASVLDVIAESEIKKGRPPLTALLIKDGCRPGPGFFDLLSKHGHKVSRSSSTKDKQEAWDSVLKALYTEWAFETED